MVSKAISLTLDISSVIRTFWCSGCVWGSGCLTLTEEIQFVSLGSIHVHNAGFTEFQFYGKFQGNPLGFRVWVKSPMQTIYIQKLPMNNLRLHKLAVQDIEFHMMGESVRLIALLIIYSLG